MKLQGIYPPIATPFNYEGELFKAKVFHNVNKLNRTALSGYCVCGSTGESVHLTPEEKYTLWGWVAEASAPDRLLIAGTGVESVRETVALTNKAAEIGYKLAMVRTPHYYKNLINNTEAQVRYFGAVADQAKLPVMIYNWPQTTGVDISVEAVVRLSEHPNVIAIKESSSDLEKLKALIAQVKPGFQVLTGSAPGLWKGLEAGAVGCGVGVCERGSVCVHHYLGSVPDQTARGGGGLAATDYSGGSGGDREVWRSRIEVCDGSEWVLWGPAADAFDSGGGSGEAGD